MGADHQHANGLQCGERRRPAIPETARPGRFDAAVDADFCHAGNLAASEAQHTSSHVGLSVEVYQTAEPV